MNIPNSPFQVFHIELIEGTYIDKHPLCSEVKSKTSITDMYPIVRHVAYTSNEIDVVIVAAYYISITNELTVVYKFIKGLNNLELMSTINDLYEIIFTSPYTMSIPDEVNVHLFIYQHLTTFSQFNELINDRRPRWDEFNKELRNLINTYSIDNKLNIADYVLSDKVIEFLKYIGNE